MSARYNIIGALASGGMGTVYLARMVGSAGFSRLVAIKRLHPEFASQAQLVAMLVDEARLAAQVRHANVINTLDLVATEGQFGLVLEYIEGAALSTLIQEAQARGEEVPRPIAMTIVRGMLRGLDAAHEARDSNGKPLGIVHRDVSPQNVLVGVDGIPRLIDFGIAKAMSRLAHTTRPGEIRGKFSYIAPEQLRDQPATRQSDVYSAGVLLWQLLVGRLPFESDDNRVVMAKVLTSSVPAPDISPELDAVVLKATAPESTERYLTARELYDALSIEPAASDEDVGAWVRRMGSAQLAKQQTLAHTVITDPSRGVEELFAELASGGSSRPTTVATPTSETARPRRTWLMLPIAAAIGGACIIAGVRVAHEKEHEEETAVEPPSSVPATAPLASIEPIVSASVAAPAPVMPRRPGLRRPKTPTTRPPAGLTSAPAPAPAPAPPPRPESDTDYR